MTLTDREARNLICNQLDLTLVVEAAAGTGKTTELVNRIISIVAEGRTTVDRIIAVTFTDKAAGELKLRLRVGLEKARIEADGKRRKNLEEALAHLEEARAGTIHSFCGDLLRERPMEAGIDPEFDQLDDAAAEQLYRSAFRNWIQGVLENPPEGVRRSLRRYAHDDQPIARLERAGWTLASWRDFNAEWKRPNLNRIAEIDRLVRQLHEFAALTRRANSTDHIVYQQTRRSRDLSEYITTIEKSRPRDYDGLEALLVDLARLRDFKIEKKGAAAYGTNLSRDAVISAYEVLADSLKRFAVNADADLAALLATELRRSIAAYEVLKQCGGKLDFFDLLLRARDLLRQNEAVRRDFQARFTHIFVDEFQDTEPLQAEILMLLASADPKISDWRKVPVTPGKLFIVGDPKQAIYRFRRADVGLYFDVKDLLVSGGAMTVQLTTSFRSAPFIQNLVNAAFAPKMNGDSKTLQADYVPLSPSRQQSPDQPSVIALSVPKPYAKVRLGIGATNDSLPDAVGAFVHWILNRSDWTVTERGRGEERVPVQPRHICLMFRRFEKMFVGDMTRAYAEALQARGIPHVLVGGKSFNEREEVGTMRSALSALEWPDDTLSVYATLRGSLFAISDADLLAYRTQFGMWHPFRIPEKIPDVLEPVKRALEILRELSRGRNYKPISETVHQLLNATRAHAAFVMRPGGEQALANVLHVAELARQYEARGAVSFRGFVEELITAAERGKQPEATIYEEGSEGVRMMSVHRSKGLEFPIVILADITCAIAHNDPDRFLDSARELCAVQLAGWLPQDVIDHAAEEHSRDEAEGIRIAYVAATRARDVLVVPAIGEDATGVGPAIAASWWVAPLYSALYPQEEKRHSPARASMCPAFGLDTVLNRPNGEPPLEYTVRPGAHGFGSGSTTYNVVWWDPTTLELGMPASFSIRQQELLERGDDQLVQRRLAEYQAWRDSRQKLLEHGSIPSIRFQTATDSAKRELALDVEPEIVEIAKKARPYGPRFGSLVHATLATVPLSSNAPDILAVAHLQGRIFGATQDEIEAAIEVAVAVLRHPLMQRARSAAARSRCYRELPLTLRMDDGTLVEGIADVVFFDGEKWTVIDFKTDQDLASGLQRYRRQVAIYATAVSKVNKAQCEAFLFCV